MDLNLFQREVAVIVGVSEETVHNWEAETHSFGLAYWPAILEFLDYDPRPEPLTIGEALRHHREGRGLTASESAGVLQVDPATVSKWER
jgi:DNA-binding transcriptional regulator YiaG